MPGDCGFVAILKGEWEMFIFLILSMQPIFGLGL